jgi:cytochrome c oxidase subunit IV
MNCTFGIGGDRRLVSWAVLLWSSVLRFDEITIFLMFALSFLNSLIMSVAWPGLALIYNAIDANPGWVISP